MNVMEAIYARRATRDYAPRDIDDRTLDTLLRAAVQAPSAMNLQPWLFVIIQNRAQLQRYSDRAKRLLLDRRSDDPKFKRYEGRLRDAAFNIFYDAGTLVAIGAKQPGPFSEADCWLAAGHLMLAACEANLGTCCIGFAIEVLNEPDVKEELGLPAGARVVAPIIVGYPKAAVPPVPRTEPNIVYRSRPQI